MPFAITGGRYAAASVSAVGTTTVQVSTAPFVQAGFTKQRLVGLWTSGGVFKGMTWVRRWVSTSQLQLERPFFDPATGFAVAQSVGDQVLVSKDFTESVVAGLSVSGRVVSITDTCTFGVNGNQMGVCLYDENKLVNATVSTLLSGGLVVLGKLDDYATNSVSSSIDWQSTNSNPILCNDSAVNFCGYGGRWESSAAPAYFVGGNNQGTAGNTVVLNGIECPNDLLTNTAGGAWARNPTRHQLVNCYSVTTAFSAIMRRWGDGIIRGGQYKFPNNTSAPISVFGSDAAGTYTVAANPGDRAVILDIGNGPALVRTAPSAPVSFNFTNLISTDFRIVSGVAGSLIPNNAGTNTFRFSDTYTSIQPGSVGVILTNGGAVADSVASSTTSWSPSLLRRTCVGTTVTVNATSWTYGFKRYGFQAVSGSITPTTYDLGTAGTADNVVFGGIVNQLADAGVTLSQPAVAALTSIANLDNLYDATINWNTSSVANAQWPSIASYPVTMSGTVLDFGNRNIVVDATASDTFSVNTGTNTITIKSSNLTTGLKFNSLVTTGTITFVNGATSSGIAIEDVNGVRVTVRKAGGGNFNIAARYGTTGSYTDLGFQSDVSTVTYTVPKGQPVEVIMWSLGYVTYGRTISTVDGGVVFDAEMVLNPNINTSLDVSSYISNITVTNGGGLFNVTFNAPMTVSGIELGKAVIHRLVGQEVALKAGFPPGSTATIEILADEIKNNLPAVQLIVGAGLSVTDRVYLDFFINQAPALAINPSYVTNPVRADGNQVQILRAKPALDSSQLAAAVRDELQTELSRIDVAVSTRLATTAYTAPANADIAAIKAKTDTLVNAPTLSQIEASTVLAKEATVAARPTLTQIEASTVLAKQSGFTGLATAANVTDAQTAIITELNANETKIDAIKVDTAAIKARTDTLVNTDISGLPTLTQIEASSVLAKASDVSTVDTKVTAIKAKTDTLVNAPTVADIEASTVLAKEATVATKASQSSVTALGSPMQASAYVAPDNTKIAEIKTKVDTLQNTDLTAVNSGIADIKGTGFDATKHNLVAIKRQASLAAALSA